MWLDSQIGVFMTEQVGRLQLSENVQRHISAVNQGELENGRLKSLGERTTNQDNEGTQMEGISWTEFVFGYMHIHFYSFYKHKKDI